MYDILTIEFNKKVSERYGREAKFTKKQVRKRKNNLNEKHLRAQHKKKLRDEEKQKASQPKNEIQKDQDVSIASAFVPSESVENELVRCTS